LQAGSGASSRNGAGLGHSEMQRGNVIHGQSKRPKLAGISCNRYYTWQRLLCRNLPILARIRSFLNLQFEILNTICQPPTYEQDRRQTRPYFPALYNALSSSLPSFHQTATTTFPLIKRQSTFCFLPLNPLSPLWQVPNGRELIQSKYVISCMHFTGHY